MDSARQGLTEIAAPPGLLVRIRGAHPYDWSGWPGVVGDVDGEGLDDLGIVGEYHRSQEPRAYVVFGERDPPPFIDLGNLGSWGFTIRAPEGYIFSSRLGSITAGDYDADGTRDLAFGVWTRVKKEVHVIFGRDQGSAAFVRGDANQDERVDLADTIAILDFLFGGGRPPGCAKAAHANDDGAVQITDAVFLLGHVFSGTEAPPEPYPGRGMDPTPDGLSCRAR